MNLPGLRSEEIEEIRAKCGSNKLTQIEPDPLWKKLLIGFTDPMIVILLVALVIQLVLFAIGEAEWFEPIGIFVAILLANGVAATSENSQEHKAIALKAEEEAREMAKVIRDGYLQSIHVDEVVLGDIVYLQAGDKIPADGLMVEGALKVDQAALNGETEEADKHALNSGDDKCDTHDKYDKEDLLNLHYIYRGTIVCAGEGYMEVKVTGDNSLFGKLALEIQEQQRKTPLQIKLDKLAHQISEFGYVGAVAIILGVLAKTFISGNLPPDFLGWVRLIMDVVTVAVTVIVCAVPEGLPMLTSILLSFQSLRMAKDNVLVRKINGLETAGSISILFSDKTGTITEGQLSVVEMMSGDFRPYSNFHDIDDKLVQELVIGLGANNGATYSHGEIVGGNSTDRAIISMLMDNGQAEKIDKSRVIASTPFDSANKFSSIVYDASEGSPINDGNTSNSDSSSNDDSSSNASRLRGVRYIKGAPEKILKRCHYCMNTDGQRNYYWYSGMMNDSDINDYTAEDELSAYIEKQAARSMRLLAVARVDDYGDREEWTLLALVSIRDNVRQEAIEAIETAQTAGIHVVMVTGDRRETAVAIAKEAGLLKTDNDLVLTSDDMKKKSDDELKAVMHNLRVVSRALPTDKSRLVRVAQEMDYVVGMTGDGVNDAPALRKADVGFAMGNGTEVAKEAGDIIILDDNFSSICKAILYGRTMFKSIRKFLLFQLTVNVAAVFTCFIAPLLGENVVLTVIQLLLINLAMDTLAAMAYGSEPALQEYMREKPIPRRESIVTRKMLVQVVIDGTYITVLCLAILFYKPISSMFGNVDVVYLKSAVFATFMMVITFNGFNARTDHMNPLENIGRNLNFLVIMFSIFMMQLVFVTFGGEALSVESLSLNTWIVCGILAALVIPVDMLRKLFIK